MAVIDWILNLACLLLWLSWRSIRLSALPRTPAISLIATLKPAELTSRFRWSYLATLIGILFLRSLFYFHIGPSVSWTPTVELGAVTLAFRSDRFPRILFYSFFGFGIWLAAFYAWLLLLSAVNATVPDTDPIQRWIRLHLSYLERVPPLLKVLLVPLASMLSWIALHSSLTQTGAIPGNAPIGLVLKQSAVIALAVLLVWRVLLVGILVLHVGNSYVYMGRLPIWQFASTTAHNLLRPIGNLPLQIGKLDLAPFMGITLVLAASEGLIWILPKLFRGV